MAPARDYKETVLARIRRDRRYARAFYAEAKQQDGRQKNGGKKIPGFYIFAPIFLPFLFV